MPFPVNVFVRPVKNTIDLIISPTFRASLLIDERARLLTAAITGAEAGPLEVNEGRGWARRAYANGAIYWKWLPEPAGPFWVRRELDGCLYRPASGDMPATIADPGLPIADSTDFVDEGRAVKCLNGDLYWWADVGCRTAGSSVRVALTTVTCLVEQDNSASDEMYSVIAVTTPEIASTTSTRVVDDFDDGETVTFNHVFYEGPPRGIVALVSLIEEDEGNREEALRIASKWAKGALTVLKLGVHFIPGFGPALGIGVAGAGIFVEGELSKAIVEVFGLDDDVVAEQVVVLTAKQMILAISEAPIGGFATVATLEGRGRDGHYRGSVGLAPA